MKMISIIVPIYNTNKFLGQCLESIINQTYKNLEIILINDGSTDNSLEIIKKYEKKDSRVKVIDKQNGGLSSARNEGIKAAEGEYILHIDSDDWVELDSCELLLENAIVNNSDIVVGNISLEFEKKTKKWKEIEFEGAITGKKYLEKYFTGKGRNTLCNKLIKRKLYIDGNIKHPEEISLGEDGATLPRLILNCKRISKIEKIVYHYRQIATSMMKNENKKILDYNKGFIIVKKYFFEKNEKDFFEKYELLYLYNFFYRQLILFTYKKAKKSNNEDYKTGWEMLKKDLKKIKNNNLFKINYSKQEIFLINLYCINLKLGDIIIEIFKK